MQMKGVEREGGEDVRVLAVQVSQIPIPRERYSGLRPHRREENSFSFDTIRILNR